MFYRAYIVDPSLSTNGAPIGGLKGTLKILQKLIRESNPDKVVVCWDGAGGSKKRRSLKKDYKAGRKPIRLNWSIQTMSDAEETENKFWQQGRLIEYINSMPIAQLMYEDIEADDIIAYIKAMPHYRDWQKVIISSDKDFFQLLDENTILHRPVQKEFLSRINILEKYEIHPNNFTLARAIAGDASDNLPGIAGAGLKTIKNRFPFLREEKSYTLTDIFNHCKENSDSKIKIYSRILEDMDTVKLNYKMMQLYSPSISAVTKKKIKRVVLETDNSFNKTEIIKLMMRDGFGDFNWSDLSQKLRKISVDNV
tara:strand:- start:8670 stop:9599 length:930 start_codon:yes stop_codon:yes gene_type:complete